MAQLNTIIKTSLEICARGGFGLIKFKILKIYQ